VTGLVVNVTGAALIVFVVLWFWVIKPGE